MDKLVVVFGSNWKFFSVFIKLFTWSKWCHCGVVDGEYIIDTTLLTGGRRILINEWVTHYRKYETLVFPVDDKEARLEYARSRVGLPYDKKGILSFIFNKDLDEKQKDFCSELVANTLGIKYKAWSLSPQYLYRLGQCLKGWAV